MKKCFCFRAKSSKQNREEINDTVEIWFGCGDLRSVNDTAEIFFDLVVVISAVSMTPRKYPLIMLWWSPLCHWHRKNILWFGCGDLRCVIDTAELSFDLVVVISAVSLTPRKYPWFGCGDLRSVNDSAEISFDLVVVISAVSLTPRKYPWFGCGDLRCVIDTAEISFDLVVVISAVSFTPRKYPLIWLWWSPLCHLHCENILWFGCGDLRCVIDTAEISVDLVVVISAVSFTLRKYPLIWLCWSPQCQWQRGNILWFGCVDLRSVNDSAEISFDLVGLISKVSMTPQRLIWTPQRF
jgi:hypothetical protein